MILNKWATVWAIGDKIKIYLGSGRCVVCEIYCFDTISNKVKINGMACIKFPDGSRDPLFKQYEYFNLDKYESYQSCLGRDIRVY